MLIFYISRLIHTFCQVTNKKANDFGAWQGIYGLVKIIIGSDAGLPVPGGRLNKKDGLTRYGNSHVKDMAS